MINRSIKNIHWPVWMIKRSIENIHWDLLVLKKYTLTCINDKEGQ